MKHAMEDFSFVVVLLPMNKDYYVDDYTDIFKENINETHRKRSSSL